ncbi:phospho-sugar mutase, partial [bacterium]|nr:phospho-sugar mutase [bacterium]
MNSDLAATLQSALDNGQLTTESHKNITDLLGNSADPINELSVTQLADAEEWGELNNRFFTTLKFGTGGLRGRSMGAIVTAAERGSASADDRPEHPCVGTNSLNGYNITRATLGLVRYVVKSHTGEGKPSIALARDTRHFGKEFAEIVGRVATENGCDLHLFVEPRSTPQLSFSVRHLNASAGIVLTASHNPPHDNGYKVYGNAGAQIVEPAAGQIVAEVNSISGDSYEALSESERGTVLEINDELDGVYMDRLESLLLDPEMVKAQSDLK